MGDVQRQLILERSSERFFRSGFSGVTMSELAQELGMSKKTLYRHFRGKEALLRACVERTLRELDRRLQATFGDPEGSNIARLKRMLAEAVALFGHLTSAFVDDLYRRAPGLWRWVSEERERIIFARLEDLIVRGREEGTVRSDVDPRLAWKILVTIMGETLTPATIVTLQVSASELFDTVTRILFGGLLTEEGRRQFGADQGGDR